MAQIFPGWRDTNAVRHYPFTDFGPPTDGQWQLSPTVFLDANIHPPDTIGGFYLARLYVDDNSDVRVEIGSQDAATAAIGIWSQSLPDLSVIPLYDLNDAPAGVLVVDPAAMAYLQTELLGREIRLDPNTSAFVASTWNFTVSTPDTAIREGERIAVGDDLYLVGEDGIRLFVNDNGQYPVVYVHAIGDPLARLRECQDEPVPRFIREVVFQQGEETITCSPNELGEIFLVVASQSGIDSALRLYSSPGELKIGFSS